MAYDITVIGAAIIDILASPVTEEVFSAGSIPMETIKMSFGGDALNETIILSGLGKKVQLISKVGDDEAGKGYWDFCRRKVFLQKVSVCRRTCLRASISF